MEDVEIYPQTETQALRGDSPPRPPVKVESAEREPAPQKLILVPIAALDSLSAGAKRRAVTRAGFDTGENKMLIIGRTEAAHPDNIASIIIKLNDKGENCRGFVDISTSQGTDGRSWVPEQTMSRFQGSLIIENGELSYLNMGKLEPIIYRDGALSDNYIPKIVPAIKNNKPFPINNGDTIGFKSSQACPVTFYQDHENPAKWFMEYADPASKQPSERTKLLIGLAYAVNRQQMILDSMVRGGHIDLDENNAIEERIKTMKRQLQEIKPEGIDGFIN